MAKRKQGGTNFALSIGVIGVIIGVPLLFVLSSMGTSWLVDTVPYVMLGVIMLAIAVYSGMTSTLLWQFYECRPPWYRWLPMFGELTLMDNKYLKVGSVFYAVAVFFLALSRIPYSLLSFLGNPLSLNFPFYMTLLAFVALAGVQVVKGIGIMDCTKTIADLWEERSHSSSGFIKRFGILGFIPYVRVVAVYGLNKPLATLVTFNDETISDTDDVQLVEEDS